MTAWTSPDIAAHGARITVPCGFGKTVVALHCIVARGRRALVVAPNTVLAEQWAERASQFVPNAHVVELGKTLRAKSRHWFVPVNGPLPEIIRTQRRRTLSARDIGRKISVRGGNLAVQCETEGCAASVEGNHFTISTAGSVAPSVKVLIEYDTKPTWVASAERRDGHVLTFAKVQAHGAVVALGLGQPVPYPLIDMEVGGATERQADIVVTTVQLLSMSPPPPAALRGCGTLVVDEVHSMCARVFSRALAVAPCSHLLALSATPERRDGLHDALPWFCGEEVIRIQRVHEEVDIDACTYRPNTGPAPRELRFGGGQLRVADMITALCTDAERSRRIAREAIALHREGRCILILGERVTHLTDIAEFIFGMASVRCGILCGATPKAARAAACDQAILLATYPMCRQGFDKARLDTLIMATPVTALEQIVGRILRVHPDKKKPRVIDVIDPYSIFAGEYRKRTRQYSKWGYKVTARDLAVDQ
jgi:superfamily II DNA or RNA helicase